MKKIFATGIALLIVLSAHAQLSQQEQTDLQYMRQEEKMAYDAYSVFYEKWEAQPFKNIQAAEKQHIALVLDQMAYFKVPDPLAGVENQRGTFALTEIKTLYTDLIAKGNTSLSAAFQAGALIEETDIRDLQSRYASTSNTAIRNTYTVLIQASENHLRAFVRNLKRQGITYTPRVLDAAEFNRIVKEPQGKRANRWRS